MQLQGGFAMTCICANLATSLCTRIDDVRTEERSCQCGTTCSVIDEIRSRFTAQDPDLMQRLAYIKQLRVSFPVEASQQHPLADSEECELAADTA